MGVRFYGATVLAARYASGQFDEVTLRDDAGALTRVIAGGPGSVSELGDHGLSAADPVDNDDDQMERIDSGKDDR